MLNHKGTCLDIGWFTCVIFEHTGNHYNHFVHTLLFNTSLVCEKLLLSKVTLLVVLGNSIGLLQLIWTDACQFEHD